MIITVMQVERCLANSSEELSLNIQGKRIDNVLNAKYLGIQVDSNLIWNGHIKVLSIKISRAIGCLKHAKSFLTQDTLKTLYTAGADPDRLTRLTEVSQSFRKCPVIYIIIFSEYRT